MAMRAIGRGKICLQSFCRLMDILPPVVAHSFKQLNKQLAQHSMKVAPSNMLAASAHLHYLHGAKSTDIIDVTVTCDGTWSNRSFTAKHGVVVFIAGRQVAYLTLRSSPNAAQFVPCRWSSWMKVPMSLMDGGRAIRPIVIATMLDHRKPWK